MCVQEKLTKPAVRVAFTSNTQLICQRSRSPFSKMRLRKKMTFYWSSIEKP